MYDQKTSNITNSIQNITNKIDHYVKNHEGSSKIFGSDILNLREKFAKINFSLKNIGLEFLKKSKYDEYKSVELIIWRKAIYDPLQYMKKDIKRNSLPEKSLYYVSFFGYTFASIGYYQNILSIIQTGNKPVKIDDVSSFVLNSNINFFTEASIKKDMDSAENLKITNIAHQTLIYLGDLVRYLADVDETRYQQYSVVAEKYYHKAIMIIPDLGMPHSQLGTLYNGRYQGLSSIFHYMNCTLSIQSFEGAHANLKRIFDRVRPMYKQVMKNTFFARQQYNPMSLLAIKFIYFLDAFYNEELKLDMKASQMLGQDVLLLFSTELDNHFKAKKNNSDMIDSKIDENQQTSIAVGITFLNDRYYAKPGEECLNARIVLQMTTLCFLLITVLQNTGSNNLSLAVAFTIGFCTYILNAVVSNLHRKIRTFMLAHHEDLLKSSDLVHEKRDDMPLMDDNKIEEKSLNSVSGSDKSRNMELINSTQIETDEFWLDTANSKNRKIRKRRELDYSDDESLSMQSDEDNSEYFDESDEVSESENKSTQSVTSNSIKHLPENEGSSHLKSPSAKERRSKSLSLKTVAKRSDKVSTTKSIKHSAQCLDENYDLGSTDRISVISQRQGSLNFQTSQTISKEGTNPLNQPTDKSIASSQTSNASSMVIIEKLIEIMEGESLLPIVKIFCYWLESHNEVLLMCSKSCQSLWTSFVSFFNVLPNENHIKDLKMFHELKEYLFLHSPYIKFHRDTLMESGIFSRDTIKSYDSRGAKPLLCQRSDRINSPLAMIDSTNSSFYDRFSQLYCDGKRNFISLTEDIYLYGCMPLKASQTHMLNLSAFDIPPMKPEYEALIRIMQLRQFAYYVANIKDIDVLYDEDTDQFFNTFTIAEKERKTRSIKRAAQNRVDEINEDSEHQTRSLKPSNYPISIKTSTYLKIYKNDDYKNTENVNLRTHDVKDNENLSEVSINNNRFALDEKKERLMRLMGDLRLQCEANVLVSKTSSDNMKESTTEIMENANEIKEGPYVAPPSFLVPDTHALCEKLHLFKNLIASKSFIIVLARSVLNLLDILKKDSSRARQVIRWIEAQMREGNKYLHVQFEYEQYDLHFGQGIDDRDKKIRLLCDAIRCAKYFAIKSDPNSQLELTPQELEEQGYEPSLTNSVKALVLTYELHANVAEKFCKTHVRRMTKGINMMDVSDFYDLWKRISRDDTCKIYVPWYQFYLIHKLKSVRPERRKRGGRNRDHKRKTTYNLEEKCVMNEELLLVMTKENKLLAHSNSSCGDISSIANNNHKNAAVVSNRNPLKKRGLPKLMIHTNKAMSNKDSSNRLIMSTTGLYHKKSFQSDNINNKQVLEPEYERALSI